MSGFLSDNSGSDGSSWEVDTIDRGFDSDLVRPSAEDM